ncbi:Glycosyltransferase family 92 protein [Frankliniella fusca]|uniref:Glycosyltransferase family 92 protein n=1 Tax=Frankliniella fusca TaxID=407009 RepID=A0AAE1H613_9NEOP|nr:Glycosyltransferase family 92 protein [Frankliniella fusca]
MIYLLVLFLHVACGKTIHSFAGPYTVYADRFYNSEKEECPWKWYLRVTHFNPQKPSELQIITGNITGPDAPAITDKSYTISSKIQIDCRSEF